MGSMVISQPNLVNQYPGGVIKKLLSTKVTHPLCFTNLSLSSLVKLCLSFHRINLKNSSKMLNCWKREDKLKKKNWPIGLLGDPKIRIQYFTHPIQESFQNFWEDLSKTKINKKFGVWVDAKLPNLKLSLPFHLAIWMLIFLLKWSKKMKKFCPEISV